MDTVLTFTGVSKAYGKNKLALDSLDLTLPKGKIIGLLGPNGSGKTTFLKLCAGLLTPSAGKIDICGMPVGAGTKAVVSYLPDRSYLSNSQTIRQQLNYFKDFYADFDYARAESMLEKLSIDPKQRYGSLSKGNKEKVQLVLVMSRRAKLYLLDEPIGGVDPAARDYILNTIVTNYDPEATVVISTHLIADIEQILDEVIFLKNGNLVLQKSVDEIRTEHGKTVDELFREVFKW